MKASMIILGLTLIGGVCACGGNASDGSGNTSVSATSAKDSPMWGKKRHHHHKKHRDNANPLLIGFTNMVGVDGAFVDSTAIRGVPGDELPWEVESATGSLRADGHLHIAVTGVVFADVPEVPANLRNINDEATFRGLVSCLADDGNGQVTTVNILTKGFPATPTGDSTIDTFVELPEGGCVAPIVFVMSGSENKWFAVTGLEGAED